MGECRIYPSIKEWEEDKNKVKITSEDSDKESEVEQLNLLNDDLDQDYDDSSNTYVGVSHITSPSAGFGIKKKSRFISEGVNEYSCVITPEPDKNCFSTTKFGHVKRYFSFFEDKLDFKSTFDNRSIIKAKCGSSSSSSGYSSGTDTYSCLGILRSSENGNYEVKVYGEGINFGDGLDKGLSCGFVYSNDKQTEAECRIFETEAKLRAARNNVMRDVAGPS